MNDERIKRSDDASFSVAVGITRTQHGNNHLGIIYRYDNGQLFLIHLAADITLEHGTLDSSFSDTGTKDKYLCLIPKMPRDRARFYPRLCRKIWTKHPSIRYALANHEGNRFNIADGDVVLSIGSNGLNCSTFVLAVFNSYGFQLIDFSTWQARPEDEDWHDGMVAWVGQSDPVQASRIRSEIGCARVRPEETAGACLFDPPASFKQATQAGFRINELLGGAPRWPGRPVTKSFWPSYQDRLACGDCAE